MFSVSENYFCNDWHTVSVIKVKRGRFCELIRRAPDMRNSDTATVTDTYTQDHVGRTLVPG